MSIIKNFGLRWDRDRVQWGSPGKGNQGSLMGRDVNWKTSDEVDFREQIGIYILYEPGFQPVYIGQAGMANARLFQRLKNHRNDHLRDRWTHFSWFGFREVNSDCSLSNKHNPDASTTITYKDALSEIEGIVIQVLEPRLNKQGPKWRQHACEFIQVGVSEEISKIEVLIDQVRTLSDRIGHLK